MTIRTLLAPLFGLGLLLGTTAALAATPGALSPSTSDTETQRPTNVSSASASRRPFKCATPQRRRSFFAPSGSETIEPLSSSARAMLGASTPTPMPIFTISLIASMR